MAAEGQDIAALTPEQLATVRADRELELQESLSMGTAVSYFRYQSNRYPEVDLSSGVS